MRRVILATDLALAFAGCLAARQAAAQSLLERPPNVSGDWVGTPGTLYFNVLHRFTSADPPTRKVTSSPTFLVAAGLPGRTLAGFGYATNSDVVPGLPNEWEAFARWAPLAQDAGAPLDLGVQAGWNAAAQSADGEVSAGRRTGALHLRAAARVLSNAHDLGEVRPALAGGGVLRLGRWLGVAGDWATMLDRPAGFEPAWSAALHLAVPYTPHTLSLHVTNTSTATLHGASAARGSARRYGFEFTIPLTLRRYLPGRATPPTGDATPPPVPGVAREAQQADTLARAAVPAPARDTLPRPDSIVAVPDTAVLPLASARDTARATAAPLARRAPAARRVATTIRQLAYGAPRLEVAAGTTITWTNRDAMVHTVTGNAGGWDSGLIEPGRTWSRRFDRPGTYPYHCAPHPFMKGVVVVRAAKP